MTLPPGSRLGAYEVVGLLGQGGMGEVYRARDRTLGREVALKVLPAAFLSDSDRLARFEREARMLASLSHPHIGAIYHVEEAPDGVTGRPGRRALVLELIEGDTLADRLRRGPLPLVESLRLGMQVASALEAAHGKGIVHRDLKPGNIKITPNGTIKVLDFGLAKAIANDAPLASANATTVGGATETGAVLGTAAYMSPEQARGHEVDTRTDVWAFGCVLYEMLTGRALFKRPTFADTFAAVVNDHPDWTALPAETPSAVRHLLERCLERVSTERLRDIGEARMTLASALAALGKERPEQTHRNGARQPTAWTRPGRLPIVAGTAVVILATATWWQVGRSWPTASDGSIRSLAVLPLQPVADAVGGNHIGMGIADSIILGVSRARSLTVRPTSAVRSYADGDTDAVKAGADLGVDAVLDGTWQQDGGRVRINLRLIRTADGSSLWSDRVDVAAGDMFALQDEVAGRITTRLQLEVLPPPARGSRRPPGAEAYDLYARGLVLFMQRGYTAADRKNSDQATSLFEQAVRKEPEFAEAHAMLGFAYAWTAIFIEENPGFIERAEVESNLAERLDAGLGQVHLNRAFIVWSWYRGWRIVDGIRSIRRALELTPTLADIELGTLHYHLGLFEDWRQMNERSVELNPTDTRQRGVYVNEYFLLNRPEEGLAAQRRLLGVQAPDWRYHLAAGQTAEAEVLVEKMLATVPADAAGSAGYFARARLRARQGRHQEAQRIVAAELPRLPKNRSYHHLTYAATQVFALGGRGADAARWLQVTIDEGFPCYPLFASDPWLDPVRQSPDVKAVMDRLKTVWDGYRALLNAGPSAAVVEEPRP